MALLYAVVGYSEKLAEMERHPAGVAFTNVRTLYADHDVIDVCLSKADAEQILEDYDLAHFTPEKDGHGVAGYSFSMHCYSSKELFLDNDVETFCKRAMEQFPGFSFAPLTILDDLDYAVKQLPPTGIRALLKLLRFSFGHVVPVLASPIEQTKLLKKTAAKKSVTV